MKRSMRKQLRAYFDSVGLSANNFSCMNCKECKAGNPNFVEATEPYVGVRYEMHKLPRILFVSLDPGSADKDPNTRTMEYARKWMTTCNPLELHRNQHWYETHKLAWRILRKFLPVLQFRKIGSYFAHTNCAKCCHNNVGNARGPNVMFENCRPFMPKEIEILTPDVLVTQGNPAKWVVEYEIYKDDKECYKKAERLDTCDKDYCKIYIIIIGKRRVIWIHSYHPNYFGGYNKQKRNCHEIWADIVYEYLSYNGWGED